jgi:endonuclease/exonuclease/phosphatase family metal-dependent hydrolase
MKKIFSLLLSFFFVLSICGQSLNVMTFNIRYNNAGDSLNAWPYRKDKAASQILFHEAHILGVQEALHDQMIDLQQRLPSYKYVGVGRDDGKEKGEYSAIFYDTTRLQLLQSQTFWLSEQPNVPGRKGWDAAITRIVTWAKFKDKKTKKQFFAFNTHFDHMGKVARRESAKLLLQKVKEIAGKNEAIVRGDFNSQPSDEPIQVITDTNNGDKLTDSKSISAMPHYGPTGTFNGFKQKEVDDQPIDYIFVKNGVRVLRHATFSQSWDGHFSSDHFPVFAEIVL